MKIKARLDWGRVAWPYRRTCDELCNSVLTFSLPLVGYIYVFLLEKRRFEDGFWTSSSGGPDGLGVYTMLDDETVVFATIPMAYDGIEVAFGGDEGHPRIWTDDEVRQQASRYTVCTEDDQSPDYDHMPFQR